MARPPSLHLAGSRLATQTAKLAAAKMVSYNLNMDISVTQFRARCLALIRQVEKGGGPVTIRRRGKAVARLTPPPPASGLELAPWERLRAAGGKLLAAPGESVLHDRDFEAMR